MMREASSQVESKKVLKIIGERNSGTNYLGKLIQENFQVSLLQGTMPKLINKLLGYEEIRDFYFLQSENKNLGWKHAMAPSANLIKESKLGNEVGFIAVAKNPYAWLLSMYQRPYHSLACPKSFDEFIVSPWIPVGRERYQGCFESPVVLWNKKNASYIELGTYADALVIPYESILRDPFVIMQKIKAKFGLLLRTDDVKNINESTKGDKIDFEFYKDYYLNNRWANKITPDQLEIINKQLNVIVMAHFGYDLL